MGFIRTDPALLHGRLSGLTRSTNACSGKIRFYATDSMPNKPTINRDRRLVPARQVRTSIRVVNSHFIATAAPVFSVDEARSFIDRMKQEFNDATHNVPAYIIGHGSSLVTHCSDDGEPSGTAGAPTLAVLRGSGLGDTAVVVTRYFGGTKLGTGGLVRAYSAATRKALDALPRAIKVPTHTIRLQVAYPIFERVRRLILLHEGQVLDEVFAADVTLTARLAKSALPALRSGLQEISRGQIQPDVIASSDSTIVPLTSTRSS